MAVLTVDAASTAEDFSWVVDAARRRLGSEHQVHSRRRFHIEDHDVLIARRGVERIGFLAWIVEADECEVLAVATDRPNTGVGTALLEGVCTIARQRGCRKLRVTTTDANIAAQRFYESRGFVLTDRLVGAVDLCRERWKPEIPMDRHDELVYERRLAPG